MVVNYLFILGVFLTAFNFSFLIVPKPAGWTWTETLIEVNGIFFSIILLASFPYILLLFVEGFKIYFALMTLGEVFGILGLVKVLTEGGFRQLV